MGKRRKGSNKTLGDPKTHLPAKKMGQMKGVRMKKKKKLPTLYKWYEAISVGKKWPASSITSWGFMDTDRPTGSGFIGEPKDRKLKNLLKGVRIRDAMRGKSKKRRKREKRKRVRQKRWVS